MTLRNTIQKIIGQGKSIESTVNKILKVASENGWIIAEQTIRYVLNQDSTDSEKIYILLEAVEEY